MYRLSTIMTSKVRTRDTSQRAFAHSSRSHVMVYVPCGAGKSAAREVRWAREPDFSEAQALELVCHLARKLSERALFELGDAPVEARPGHAERIHRGVQDDAAIGVRGLFGVHSSSQYASGVRRQTALRQARASIRRCQRTSGT